MGLKAGTINDLSNSMAKAIEEAFLSEWPKAKQGQSPPAMNDDMRLIFVAVAQGVVKHLKVNENAFEVTVNTTDLHSHTAQVEIDNSTTPNPA